MKIILNENEIVLTDEEMDKAGFVDVIVRNSQDQNDYILSTIHINQLYPAVKAFKVKHDESLKRDELLRD